MMVFVIDIFHSSSGHQRSVDWIDFILFILRTLMVECIHMQYMELSKKYYENAFNLQDSTKAIISALLSSSEACSRLSEMF